jgi:hypothetical protein
MMTLHMTVALSHSKCKPRAFNCLGPVHYGGSRHLEGTDKYQVCCRSTHQPTSVHYSGTILHGMHTKALKLVDHTIPAV